jgi:hypothetical protein
MHLENPKQLIDWNRVSIVKNMAFLYSKLVKKKRIMTKDKLMIVVKNITFLSRYEHEAQIVY